MQQLSHLTGLPLLGESACTRGFGNQTCHVPMGPLTWCGLPPGLVGSQLLDKSQIRWSRTESHEDLWKLSQFLDFGPALVESKSLPKAGSAMPDASSDGLSEKFEKFQESREAGAKPAGKEDDSETSVESEPLPVPKSAHVVSGRRHHRLRNLVDHRMCRNGMLKESLLKRRVVRALTAPRSHQSVLGQFFQCVKEGVLRLVKDEEVNDARVAHPKDCSVLGFLHHQGSQLLAAVMDRWPSCSRFGSSELPRKRASRSRFGDWWRTVVSFAGKAS